jgi:Phosphotransferase enzyme family
MTPDLSAFGAVRLVRPLPGGHRNQVWLVDKPAGLAVAKSTRHEVKGLAWLAPLQAAARKAGFILPAFHHTADGGILSNGWTIEDRIEGRTFSATDMRALTPRLCAFHKAVPALPQRPGLHSLLNAPTAHLPPEIAARCRAAMTPFADHPTQAIHGDINLSNLIHTANGPALIDWDEARVDLVFLDFIHVTSADPTEIRAHLAGEIITGWTTEPLYAQTCATRLAHL